MRLNPPRIWKASPQRAPGLPISILALSPVGEVGGAEVALLTLLKGLRDAGMRVNLLALGEGPLVAEASAAGLAASAAGSVSFRRPLTVVKAALAFRGVVRQHRPNVVITSHVTAQYVARLGSPSQRPPHIALLWDPPNRQRTPDRLSVFLPCRRVAITAEVAAGYRSMRRRVRVDLVPPGVDERRLRRVARKGSAERVWRAAGLAVDDAPRLLMVARLQPQKGALDLVQAMRELAQRSPVRCLIIGPDEPLAPGHRQEIIDAIAEANLGHRMAVSARVSLPDLAATMADASLLVHPARSEPFGLAIVEALALGTPVAAYAASGPCAILEHGGGVTVPISDTHALAAANEDCLVPATRRKLHLAAAAVAAQFSAARSIEMFHSIVRDTLNAA